MKTQAKAVAKAVKTAFQMLPLIGGLAEVRLRDHAEAVTEVGLNLLLSTVPIWFGALIILIGNGTHSTWFELMKKNMHSGEFCLYATAMLGPLYYFIFKEYPSMPRFPSGRGFMIASAVILLLSGGLFAAQRAESILGTANQIDHGFIFALSWKVYIIAVVIVYIAHVYKNYLESGAASITNSATQTFVDDFNTTRGG